MAHSSDMPRFECDNANFQRYFEHRFCASRPTDSNAPEVARSKSAPPREIRWIHDPAKSRTALLHTLTKCTDGADSACRTFCNADIGAAAKSVYEVHPDQALIDDTYPRLAELCERHDRCCSNRVSGAVCLYNLARSLGWMSDARGDATSAQRWRTRAARIADLVRTGMWSADEKRFHDIPSRDGRPEAGKSLSDFHPFLTDIATPAHATAIRAHLLSPSAFWTNWPFPLTPINVPAASERSGAAPRTDIVENCRMADVLCRSAEVLDPDLRPYAAAFVTRFLQMLFPDGDAQPPAEHRYYDSHTGRPCNDADADTNDSGLSAPWVADILIRYAAGLRPCIDGSIVVQPMTLGLGKFSLTNCLVAGNRVSIEWTGKRMTARVGPRRETAGRLERIVFPAHSAALRDP